MILLLLVLLVFIYLCARQIRLVRKLKSCGFNVVMNITGFFGFNLIASPNFPKQLSSLHNIYGSTFAVLRGAYPIVVTSDPTLIRSISTEYFSHFHGRIQEPLADDPKTSDDIHMFAASGERWKRLRTLMSLALSAGNLKTLYSSMNDSVTSLLDFIGVHLSNKPCFITEPHALFQNHTSDVLVRCAYGRQYSTHKDNQFLKIFRNAFGFYIDISLSLANISYFLPELNSLFKMVQRVANYIKQNVNKQRFFDYLRLLGNESTLNKTSINFMGVLKEHEHENATEMYVKEQSEGCVNMRTLKVSRYISSGEIDAQCRFIANAGFDTTSNTIAMLTYLLAKHPQEQQMLRVELDDYPSIPTYDDVQKMSTLHNHVMETLRLYPHASPLQHRVCTADCVIDGFEFKKGFGVIINPWRPHRDREIWGDDADTFRPSRFENMTNVQKQAFMPFGAGPRQCVGLRFALLEIKLTVSRFLRHYKIKSIDDKEVEMTVRDTGTLWPNKFKLMFSTL